MRFDLIASFTLLLVVSVASAVPAQSEQVQSPNLGEYLPGHYKPAPPPQYLHGHSDHADFHYNHPLSQQYPENSVSGQAQNLGVAGNSQQAPLVAQPVVSVVSSQQQQQPPPQAPSVVEVSNAEPQAQQQPPQVPVVHQHPAVANYYAPAGLINVVGEQQPGVVGNKPVRAFEQYGQPESASLPPNYKPFGSWGLYIGGNPADGYYTNYYKSLGANNVGGVDKQQVSSVEPAVKPALSSVLRQAGPAVYNGANDYYSFAYSPSDLSSASRVNVDQVGSPVHHSVPVSHSPSVQVVSPVQAGAQVYGSPNSFESNYVGVSPYADMYATKKLGQAAFSQKEVQKETSFPKGYQSRVYVYPPVGQLASPVAVPNSPVQVGQAQQQVVAYPVPVGSQIVGSQPGVEGAFAPYGVHGFTRYAVKPTVVSSDPSYYYGLASPAVSHQAVQPAYKQQVYQSQSVVGSQAYYPFSYYGYPLNQLHYSQGSVVPQVGSQVGPHSEVGVGAHHVPVQPVQVEAASSEKTESEDKSVNNKQQQQQKRA